MASNVAPATCNQNNGLVELNFTGGLPPYSVNFNGIPLGTMSNTLQINGLAPGNYSFSVIDQTNTICTGVVSVMVSSVFNNPPTVTLSAVPASCFSCWDGSISAMAIGTAPFTFLWSTGSTTPNLYNVTCGTYNLVVTDANGCSSVDTVVLNCNPTLYLQGKTYYDTNNDGVFNVGDYPLPNQIVELLPSNQIVYSNFNGDYSFLVDTGSYQLAFLPQSGNPFQNVNGSDTLNVLVTNASILNLDFALYPDSLVTDYLAMSNFWLPRCNSIQTLLTAVTNYGTTIDSLHVNIIFPSSISFFNSSSFNVLNGDTLSYYLSGVLPGQTIYLNSNFLLPGGGIQFPIKSYVTSIGQNGNQTSYDTTTVNTLIICGCDPNDKQVSPQTAFITLDSTLNYLIRFQNTGTDTTFKVVVIDTLEATINPSTFKLQATSHPCQVFRENNILKFVFDNILLPDSNTNEPLSHGFIFFSVNVVDNSSCMTVTNKAHIFFDANADVETPYSFTTFVVCVGLQENNENSNLTVYPNPALDFINLNFDFNNEHQYGFSLFNSFGQVVIDNQILSSSKINLSSELVTGVYLLEILDKTDNFKFKTKIQIK
jgi:uncharacterized repeat protein (TIGR01451 family)